MPTIHDYLKADCTLFRLPDIAITEFDDLITRIVTDAWTKGMNAHTAVQSIEGQLVDTLAGKLEQSLAFQRDLALSAVEQKANEKTQGVEADYTAQHAQVEGQNTTLIANAQQAAAETYTRLGKEQERYSHAERQLGELQHQITEKVGGTTGLMDLAMIYQIHSEVSGEEDMSATLFGRPIDQKELARKLAEDPLYRGRGQREAEMRYASQAPVTGVQQVPLAPMSPQDVDLYKKPESFWDIRHSLTVRGLRKFYRLMNKPIRLRKK